MSKRIDVVLNSQYEELMDKYEKLRTEFRRMEKEFNKLQVEHSRMLFDMDAVVEYEADLKAKKLTSKLEKKKSEYKDRLDRTMDMIEDMSELINLFRLLIYDTKDMTNDERVEKI
jgi:hypothetical protein